MKKWMGLLLALVIVLLLVTACSTCDVTCRNPLSGKTYTKFNANGCDCKFPYIVESCSCDDE